jgi:hypothetical protein
VDSGEFHSPNFFKEGRILGRKVADDAAVAYFSDQPGKDWPSEISWDGPGFYVVQADDENDHQNASFGKKVEWHKDTPDKEDDEGNLQVDHENNKGHFEYAGTESGSDNK